MKSSVITSRIDMEEYVETDLLCCFYDKNLNRSISRYFSKQELLERIAVMLDSEWPVLITHGAQVDGIYHKIITYTKDDLLAMSFEEIKNLFDQNDLNPIEYPGEMVQHVWWI